MAPTMAAALPPRAWVRRSPAVRGITSIESLVMLTSHRYSEVQPTMVLAIA